MRHLLALIAVLLAGCAETKSFEKSPEQMIATLSTRAPTANSISRLSFKIISSIPFRSANWSSADWEILDENAQVFEFEGFKGYVLAYELPAVGRDRTFGFASLPTTSHIKTRGVFNPVFRAFDTEFRELAIFRDFPMNPQRGIFEGQFHLPLQAKYLIIHTTRENLQKSGAYIYRSNEGGMWFTSTVANPILPEGAFRISLE